jgi:2-keto-3-deoxy-L-rhamnonate aldolase RhmA
MNAFRQLLKSSGSHAPIGTWLMSASPIVAEALGHAGLEWGVLDMEHSPLDMAGVVQLLQALGNTRMVPVVRVPWNEPVAVKRVLDAGAGTVLFPYVQNAAEARAAVAATRYPPQGVRGVAGMTRATRYGMQVDYVHTANRSVGVIVQLESAAALDALDEIAAVDGVDALFVGPADLAADMGHLGRTDHPAVLQAMAEAARRAAAAGVPIGSLGGTPEMVVRYRAMGYQFLAMAADIGLLMRGAQAALAALAVQEGGAHVHSLTAGTAVDAQA